MAPVLTFVDNKMVCPFRTATKMTEDENGIPTQLVEFPECQGSSCPFYDKNQCLRALTMIEN